jgi:beta-glucosidase
LDPVLLGKYPEAGLQFYGADAPEVEPNDFKIISEPVDFLGLNTYQGILVESDQKGSYCEVALADGYPRTAFNWPITPEALYWGPRFCAERYKKPIVITENGVSVRDWIAVDGAVHDHARIDFCTRYIRQLARAIEDGADVRGYMLWSIMDNFEWAEGYKERFGLVYVDYQTQQRTLKDSAHWYRKVIESNGEVAL